MKKLILLFPIFLLILVVDSYLISSHLNKLDTGTSGDIKGISDEKEEIEEIILNTPTPIEMEVIDKRVIKTIIPTTIIPTDTPTPTPTPTATPSTTLIRMLPY